MAETKAVYWGTGRRKTSVARVRLTPGEGTYTINGRPAADYFGRAALVAFIEQPLRATETLGRFDVIATIHGGGISGQATDIKVTDTVAVAGTTHWQAPGASLSAKFPPAVGSWAITKTKQPHAMSPW